MKKFETVKKLGFRLLLALLLLTLIGAVCSGCATNAPQTVSVDISKIEYPNFSETETDKLAEFLTNHPEAYTAFVAAYRGYDIIKDQPDAFDIEKDKAIGAPLVDTAKKILEKYDDKEIKELDKIKYNEKLTAADMGCILGERVYSLSKDNLKILSDFLANNGEAYIAFIAAYRGYDMTQADFNHETERPQLEPSAEYAKNVLKKFAQNGSLSSIDYTTLTVDDMTSVINALKTNIPMETSRGLFGNIQYGIGVALGVITNTIGFGNYLIGICIFAILIEILLLPLSIKQQKNSIKQAKLRPKEMAIRRKYAGRNDQPTQQKIQTEIQELYQRENFSPMGGCLPLLIQLPIILILYNIVLDPIRYTLGLSSQFSSALSTFFSTAKAAGGFGGTLATSQRGTIELLSQIKEGGIASVSGLKDFIMIENGAECYSWLEGISNKIPSFSIGAFNSGVTPSINEFNWYWLIPVVTFAVYFGSMKLTRKFSYQSALVNDQQMGCSNNIMDISMPLMSVFISFQVPATISVYWIFKSLLGTVKQFVLSRLMPMPQCTEEDIKAAERELKGKKYHAPARSASSASGNKPRSLHHIDDDDETTPAPKNTVAKKSQETHEPQQSKESASSATEQINSPIDQAPLKDDTDKPSKKD